CNLFKGELSRVNGEQSRQSRVNREQNDINANNCRTVNSRQFTHNSSLSTVHSHAFTLAETLIVMGIIGVVAALTIPNVNKNTGEAEKVARFKKIYAELSEAHDRATAVYGPIEKWFVNDNTQEKYAERYLNRITEFMKVTKICNSEEYSYSQDGCLTDSYINFLDDSIDDTYFIDSSAILANGASFGVSLIHNKCDWYYYTPTNDRRITCGHINLDIDGPKKGKNTWGIDLFMLAITKEGLKPAFESSEYLSSHMDIITRDCTSTGQWIMDFGNMEYLNVYHEGDNAGLCKNNTNKQLGYPATTPQAGKTIVQSCK
ncbi:type II secretion system protein, partial [bacterium]|nr:type II secretion system protein [bacterium]